MICESTIFGFDGDVSASLHAANRPDWSPGLRFIAWNTIEKASGLYADPARAPELLIAWAPRHNMPDERPTPSVVDAALADPDHVPLLWTPQGQRVAGYVSDDGDAFPVVRVKQTAMVLVIRLRQIAAGTHGQLTFGWLPPPKR